MTIEEIKKALEEKIKEFERRNNLRSLEVIEWLKELIAKMEFKEEKPTKEVKVELPEEAEEKKPAPKKKIVFKKKQLSMEVFFHATEKQ